MVSAKKRIWGWYFFDWASQPYNTLLLTFVFGPYFAEVARGYYMAGGMDADAAAAAAQSYWGWGLAIASIFIAVLAPLLGAIADSTGRRLIWVWVFSVFYIVGAWGLWWVAPGGEGDMLALCDPRLLEGDFRLPRLGIAGWLAMVLGRRLITG